MYFETGQGSALSAEAHHGLDQLTLEARAYGVARAFEPLSAYMAYRPKATDTDANRNLIANIHARGVSSEQAAQRILNLAATMMKTQASGCQLREELPTLL